MNQLFNCRGYYRKEDGGREVIRAYVAALTVVQALQLFASEYGNCLEYTVEPETTVFLQRTL